MSASTQVRIPPVETEFVDIPETQLKVSRAALGVAGWSLNSEERDLIERIVNAAVPILSARTSWHLCNASNCPTYTEYL